MSKEGGWGSSGNSELCDETASESREFWPDPWLDYDEHRQRDNGNKPLSVLLGEMIATLESLTPCEYLDHVQGTNMEEWCCPRCKTVYGTSGFKPYCGCQLKLPHQAVLAAAIVKKFLDESAAELLNRGYALDKGTCTAHHTDAMSVKATRKRLFREASALFLDDRTTLKLEG